MTAQPTPEGPYYVHDWPEGQFYPHSHKGRWWLRERDGDDDEDGPFVDKQRAQDEADIRNERFKRFFAQGQASSAKEVEVYRRALEIVQVNKKFFAGCLTKQDQIERFEFVFGKVDEALLTSKPEPVAPVRKWEAEEEK